MAGRIVLFGATGYTGRLTAEALVARGAKPVLAARSVDRLRALGDELGGLEIAIADVVRPESVSDLVERGDVLVTTVGPFAQFGDPALDAAVRAGAHYLDSTGESQFIRRVFEVYGPRADGAGCGLVTAFGYDWVPGNLAAALALREAGEAATRVDVAYYYVGRAGMSGGTRASAAGVVVAPHFAWRDGRLVTERGFKRFQDFEVEGRERPAASVGSSEHFALPRLHPRLREVNVYLGWFDQFTRPLQAVAAGVSAVTSVPGVRGGLEALLARAVTGSTGGPGPESRAKARSHILAIARDGSGHQLAEVRVAGVNGYDFTGNLLAWGAETAAAGGIKGTGALGPVEAFGLDELEAGCREAGIERVG